MNNFYFEKIDPEYLSEKHFNQYADIEQNCGLAPFPMWLIEECLFSGEYDNFACYIDDDLVGFITSANDYRYKNSIYIANLNVDERYRNKGIATGLIKEMCHYYRKQRLDKMVSLDVMVDNDKAKSLYEKLGFREYPLASSNGDGNIIMVAPIKDLYKNADNILKSSNKR